MERAAKEPRCRQTIRTVGTDLVGFPASNALSVLCFKHATNPQIVSVLREEYLRLLARAEEFARNAPKVVSASPRPKSIRRRIFEWFERG